MRRKPWTPARIEAWERRLSAVHEAGHYVIAQQLRIEVGRARIWRREAGEDGTLWGGNCEFRLEDRQRLGHYHRAMHAVAGMVAEVCWYSRDPDARLSVWEYEDQYLQDPDCMSETDWAGTGCLPGEPLPWVGRACVRVQTLLWRDTGKFWPELLSVSRTLIRAGAVGPATRAPRRVGKHRAEADPDHHGVTHDDRG
jgi:hypothetical protein